MEKQHALQQLEQLQKKLYAIHYACSAMNLDADTVAPKNTSEGRGVALGVLAGEEQQLMICPETRALLDELDRQKDELDLLHRREVEELRRRCDQLTRIPAEEYIAYSELVNKAGDVWHKAKEKDDFAMFCPLLQELVEYNRKFAAYYDSTRAPYDALLNEYERGVDTKMLDEFFATLRQTIVPLLQKIARKPQIDDSFLHNYYPVDKQKAFADYLMQVMGLDRGHCGLGETEQEVLQTLSDLREAGVDIVTIGQYLQPTRKHLPVQQYVHPDLFARYRRDALAMGFRYVQSGPLVRSSYHAAEQVFPLDPAE